MTENDLKYKWRKLGGHVHVRVFTGVPGFTYAKAGDLVFDEKEWPTMYDLLSRGGARTVVEPEEQAG